MRSLCKILCPNLCCLIHSTYELGVVANFWEDAEEAIEPESQAAPAPDMSDLIDAYAWI